MRNHKVLVFMSVLALWLMLGTLAAFQRGYIGPRCIAPTAKFFVVLAGPVNYVGLPTQKTRSNFHFWNDDVNCD